MKGHTGAVISLIELDAKKHLIVSGSADGSIRLWNSLSATCLSTIERDSDPALSIIQWTDSCFLTIGKNDLKVYTPEDCILQYCVSMGETLLKLKKQSNMLLSGHYDGTVRLWSLSPMRSVSFNGSKTMSYIEFSSSTECDQLLTASFLTG